MKEENSQSCNDDHIILAKCKHDSTLAPSHLHTAPPIYSLLVNGNVVYINSTEALIISSGSTVTATCLAQDSRPSSNISLLVDEDVVHSNSDLWERYSNTSWNTSTEFYYTIKTVRYFARPPGGSISCIGSWPLSANDTELRKLYTVFHAYETGKLPK